MRSKDPSSGPSSSLYQVQAEIQKKISYLGLVYPWSQGWWAWLVGTVEESQFGRWWRGTHCLGYLRGCCKEVSPTERDSLPLRRGQETWGMAEGCFWQFCLCPRPSDQESGLTLGLSRSDWMDSTPESSKRLLTSFVDGKRLYGFCSQKWGVSIGWNNSMWVRDWSRGSCRRWAGVGVSEISLPWGFEFSGMVSLSWKGKAPSSHLKIFCLIFYSM